MADLDRELLLIQLGDARAFARWLRGAEPALRAQLRRFAAQVDVEAVLQEALLRVWHLAPRVVPDGRPNALLRFAATVARNLAVSEARRLRSVAIDEPVDPPIEPIEPDPFAERALRACLEELPPQPRRALRARLGATGADDDATLAERLRMRLNTFLQNVTRARKLLLRCLAGKGVEVEVAR